MPILDANLDEVIHIDFPTTWKLLDRNLPILSTETTFPPSLDSDNFAASKRERIPPPMKKFDFLPDLLAEDKEYKARDDVKPLHIVQPEGVSFKMNGHELEWQKWKMHIGESLDFDLQDPTMQLFASVHPSRGYRALHHHI